MPRTWSGYHAASSALFTSVALIPFQVGGGKGRNPQLYLHEIRLTTPGKFAFAADACTEADAYSPQG
jgi:hypothetical protein